MMLAFRKPEQKQCDRRDQSSGRWNRKTAEILRPVGAGFSFVIRRRGIETGQAQRAASEINESNDPTRIREFIKNDAINHQRRCESKGNDVGERIELASKRAFMSSETGQSPIQKIENK